MSNTFSPADFYTSGTGRYVVIYDDPAVDPLGLIRVHMLGKCGSKQV